MHRQHHYTQMWMPIQWTYTIYASAIKEISLNIISWEPFSQIHRVMRGWFIYLFMVVAALLLDPLNSLLILSIDKFQTIENWISHAIVIYTQHLLQCTYSIGIDHKKLLEQSYIEILLIFSLYQNTMQRLDHAKNIEWTCNQSTHDLTLKEPNLDNI